MRPSHVFSAVLALAAFAGLAPSPLHAVPQHVSYQGQLLRNGTPFEGNATFKFVIFNGTTSLWSNDGTSVNLSQPTGSVSVVVTAGVFSVRLGEAPMVALTADLLGQVANASLRIWVNTGSGFEQLSDQPLSSGPYTLHSDVAERALGPFTASGIIYSTTGGFRFPDGTVQTTAAAGGGGGTLDQAYDFGGPGAGRTITADAGAVNVAGPNGLTVNGNLGVGTTSPAQKLHVVGTTARFDATVLLKDPGASAANQQMDLTGGYSIYRDAAGAGGNNTRLWIDGPATGEMVLGPRGGTSYLGNLRLRSDNISLETSLGGGSQVKLLQNGNVGIGTATPDHRLHVAGSMRADALDLHHPNGTRTVEMSGNEPIYGAGYLILRSSPTVSGVRISGRYPVAGSSRGGGIDVYDQAGVNNFELRGNFDATFGGCWMALKDGGNERITLAAENGATGRGGLVDVRNDAGAITVKLTGDDGTGKGRVTTSVLEITGGADLSEPFRMSAPGAIPPGAVVVIDDANPGRLKLSDRPYDRRVAGVVSGAGGVSPGLTMGQPGLADGGVNVALTGRAYVLADAASGPIQPGDLLTSADRPGHAMAASDPARSHGAILGKAMTGLAAGQGLVLVLVNLQ